MWPEVPSASPRYHPAWTLPSMRPTAEVQSSMLPSRLCHLPEARARFGDRVERLPAFFGRVDPLADDVVAAIEGTPGGWHLFDEAARRGVDRVAGAPAAFRALFD